MNDKEETPFSVIEEASDSVEDKEYEVFSSDGDLISLGDDTELEKR